MTRARDIADLAGAADAGTVTGKSLIINGDMAVSQRGGSAATVTNGSFRVDRFELLELTDGTYTAEQSTTAPEGFTTSLKLACTATDTSLAAGQYSYFRQSIEAQNLQHLKYGTSSAEDITLSFWVRSSKTGTYCITIEKVDTTRYHFVKEYSIDTADTWEYKTITVSPDSNIKASGGVIDNDNGIGLRADFWLASGSTFNTATDNTWSSDTNDYATSNQVNWMDSTSNDFYLTGVKLEVGTTATSFQHESYAENLQKCQRYYYRITGGVTYQRFLGIQTPSTTNGQGTLNLPTEMRALPTIDNTGTASNYAFWRNNAVSTCTALPFIGTAGSNNQAVQISATSASMTSGQAGDFIGNNNTSVFLGFNAEL
jgi:hypothetical protein